MAVYYRAGGDGNKTHSLFEPNAKAGQSVHGIIGWKSILATNDDLAIADPKMAEKLTELAKSESQQSAWKSQQQKSFEYQNERFQHMWHIVKQEILCEHDRERRLLLVDENANRRETEVGIWKERNAAADRLIETLKGYGYMRGTNEADYLIKGMEMWKAEMAKSRKRLQESGSGATVKRKGRRRKGKSMAKQGGDGSHLMSSLVRIRSRGREGERANENATGDEQTDTDHSENESPKRGDPQPVAQASKGGYYGLGFLSTVGAKETISPLESSTQVTGQLLMHGALGLVSLSNGGLRSPQSSLLLPPASVSKSLTSGGSCTSLTSFSSSRKGKDKSSASTRTQGASTVMARKKLEEKQMEQLAARYTSEPHPPLPPPSLSSYSLGTLASKETFAMATLMTSRPSLRR
jgi:hypothetical protein